MPRRQSIREHEADLARREALLAASTASLRRQQASLEKYLETASSNHSKTISILTELSDRIIEAVSPIPTPLQSAALSELLTRARIVRALCCSDPQSPLPVKTEPSSSS